jgi:hypothetical protein
LLSHIYKVDRIFSSTFDIHDSIFDIRFFRVSFSTKLAALLRRLNFSGQRLG